jgi:hypothetical protein
MNPNQLLEEHEQKVIALREALIEGEQSGKLVPFSMKDIIAEARRETQVIEDIRLLHEVMDAKHHLEGNADE